MTLVTASNRKVVRERSILLSEPTPSEAVEYEWSSYKERKNGGYIKCWRIGNIRYTKSVWIQTSNTDLMYRSENSTLVRESATVSYDTIREATNVVVDDNNSDRPWDNCDGWKHEFESTNSYLPLGDYYSYQNYVRASHHTNNGFITTNVRDLGLSTWKYYHHLGASKQVAHELEAQGLQQAISQLKTWYEDGWYWYGVTCEYGDYEAGVWGIDDEEYANDSVVDEIASEVAHMMERDGWLVEGEPNNNLKYGWSADDWRIEYKRKLHMFDVRGS